jgi:hypothetical protein
MPMFLAQQVTNRPPRHRYVAGVSRSGRYLVDQTGIPILPIVDHQWNLVCWGGGRSELSPATTTPELVFQGYAAHQASCGFNGCLFLAIGSDQGGEVGPYQDGRTWDGVTPWGGGGIGDLNPSYWARVDSLLNALAANGITAWVNLISSYTLASGTAFAALNTTNAATFGSALAARYAAYPNIVWQFGVDYFANFEAEMAAVVTALRSGGDSHPAIVEYMAESGSRVDSANAATGAFGTGSAVAFDDTYTYNASYLEVERSWQQSSPTVRPVMYFNGYYDQQPSTWDTTLLDDELWALTSGSAGFFYASETTWQWGSGAYAAVLSDFHPNTWLRRVRAFWTSQPGWQNLVPDIGSTFLTGSRGTKVSALSPGGGGGSYSGGNTYLTGGVTADGTLAVIYTPTSRTITLNGAQLVSSYTATWYDPYSFATTAAASSATSYATPGTNSQGNNRWLLVLRG